MKIQNDKTSKYLLFFSWFLMLSGLITLLVYLFDLIGQYTIFSNAETNLEATGQVGDFVGGVIGSCWALAGVILLYLTLRIQSKQFQEQRKEMKLQRLEIGVNRISQLINNQKTILYSHTDKMKLQPKGKSGGTKLYSLYYANTYVREYFPLEKNMGSLTEKERDLFIELRGFFHYVNINEFINDLQYSVKLISDLIRNLAAQYSDLEKTIKDSTISYLKTIASNELRLHEFNFFLHTYKLFLRKDDEYKKAVGLGLTTSHAEDLEAKIKGINHASHCIKEIYIREITLE